jgi:biopolymer transport protein ExbB
MVGLFGTVYGMIMLFNAIVLAGGQPQTIQLADGISVALVTTFWGLLIAIPAVGIHGVFRNRIEALVNDAVVAAEGIMPEIKRGLERQQRAEAQRAGRPSETVREFAGKSAGTVDEGLPSR